MYSYLLYLHFHSNVLHKKLKENEIDKKNLCPLKSIISIKHTVDGKHLKNMLFFLNLTTFTYEWYRIFADSIWWAKLF